MKAALLGSRVDVEPEIAELWREYRYRTLFRLTHEQYLDSPAHDVDWMLAIDNTYTDAQNEMRRRANE